MNSRINIPSSISYAKTSDIISFTTSSLGNCQVEVDAWITIPFVKGSLQFETGTKKTPAGDVWVTELAAGLSQKFKESLPVIIKLEFEDSDTIIIGVPDFPVKMDVEYSLTRKRVKFSHKNKHEPYKLVN